MSRKKDKSTDNFLESNYKGLYIFNLLISMFKWIVEGIPSREIEILLVKFGMCGIIKRNGKLQVVQGSRGGELDEYGHGKKFIWVTGDGDSGESDIGIDCVVINNNSMWFTDLPIIKYIVSKLQEADKTENVTLVLARLMPIFAVSDENQKKRVETVISNIEEGKLTTIVSDDVLQTIATQGKSKCMDVINVTDIENVDKLQYVVKFYDDIIRRVCNMFGLPMDSSGKMAQLNIKETEGHEALSQMYPLDKLRNRKEAIEEINSVFGVNASVEFTEVWKHCEQVMLESNVNDPTKVNDLGDIKEGKGDE